MEKSIATGLLLIVFGSRRGRTLIGLLLAFFGVSLGDFFFFPKMQGLEGQGSLGLTAALI